MADFRQLALEYVLAEEESKLTSLAQQSASELAKAPANSNPVARWVEAVQPWMPGANGDDEMADGFESTNWTARAKALDYLSKTLDFLDKDLLKPSQIKLLISFFSAMFDIDHKAGIMASSTALARTVSMKAFQPASGDDILNAVCALKDDFPRQLAKTRLAVFELLRLLLTDAKVAEHLRQRHGADSQFMRDLLKLCQNERDPNCLMVWFDVLSKFLRNFEPSPEVIEEVYGTFKAYFPISLPRASQSGITPEELKQALRSCFTSNYQLAPHTFPFLVGKLDQGDGVTVNVKVDILRTIQACVEEYQNPEQSVAPYFEQVWASLKYEVRNGEIEDTIWATLEVLKAFARRLQGDKLRDYALGVTRDCVHDLSNAMYTAAAGRLLVSVLSASPAAFVLMASPAITHIKENLRHPKSPSHTQDLLKLLHVLLETRLLLVDAEMTAQERSDFTAIDVGFTSLYGDVYEKPVGLGLAAGAGQDDLKTASQAVQGVGALVCQRSAAAAVGDGTSTQLLLPESKCLEICDVLFGLVIHWTTGDDATRNEASDELVNETIKALQRTVTSIPNAFAPLVKKASGLIQPAWKEQGAAAVPVIQAYGPILAYIGCSELPRSSPGFGLNNFLILTSTLSRELLAAIESGTDVQVWSAFVAGLQSSARHFNDACRTTESETETAWSDNSLADIVQKYPSLDSSKPVEDIASHVSASQAPSSTPAIRVDFLLSSLAIARQLYLNATKPGESSTGKTINLSDRLSGSDISSENQYLHLVATLTGFILHEMSETQQTQLAAQNYALHLFRSDYIQVQATASAEDSATRLDAIGQAGHSSWDWLAFDRANILSRGILEALRPSAVAKLFEVDVAQDLLASSVTRSQSETSHPSAGVARSILTILSNKYKIETLEHLMKIVDTRADTLTEQLQSEPGHAAAAHHLDALAAIAAGMLRRNAGKQAQSLLRVLKASLQSTTSPTSAGAARRLEALVVPQDILSKENFAVVRPLWTQKTYFDVVKPLLATALKPNENSTEDVRANVSAAVLLMVRHMDFTVYEDDAEDILRVAISVAQRGISTATSGGSSADVRASLHVLKDILVADKDKGRLHLKSIVSICVDIFSRTASGVRPDPHCVKLSLEITGGLPNMFEAQHLLMYRPRVERELALACGNPVREARRTARLAREAWERLK